MKKLLILTFLLLPLNAIGASIQDYSPIGYYTLDETSGVRYDETGNGYDLTDNNSVGYTTGQLNNAADLSVSSSQYLGNNSYYNFTDDYTFSGWVYFKDTPTAYAYAWVAKLGAGTTNRQYQSYYDATNLFVFQTWTGTGGTKCENTYSLSTGTWYYLTYVMNEGVGCVLYVNGSNVSSTTHTTAIHSASVNFFLGNRTDLNYHANAYFDELAVFDYALSELDVTTIYNSGSPLGYYEESTSSTTPFLVIPYNTNMPLIESITASGTDYVVNYASTTVDYFNLANVTLLFLIAVITVGVVSYLTYRFL